MQQWKYLPVVLLALAASVNGATILFTTNPLQGDPALITPGRQIVNGAGGGPVSAFNPATDIIAFDPGVFGFSSVQFANGITTDPSFPTAVTIAVVQNATAAAAAADVLAARITTPTPGFFVYFNTGLNVPRLVFSTDLSSAAADLAILARFNNLTGQPGVLPTISASNFAAIPEPSTLLLTFGGFVGGCIMTLARRRRRT
jgi:hypothetical protein